MGLYLNAGHASFREALDSEIYVDKTEMIMYLNRCVGTNQKYICVSRPRRFGKSVTAGMLCAYYGSEVDSRSLFENTRLADQEPVKLRTRVIRWDSYLNAFEVVRIVITDFIDAERNIEASVDLLNKEVCDELMEYYPEVNYGERIDLYSVMSRIYDKYKKQFVIIIDEWDALFREFPESDDGQRKYLNLLREWLKDREYVALAYITGILPIKKYGVHSALNMFDEFSMIAPLQLAKYTGFTDEEVRELCRQYGREYDQIKEWYDGYEVLDVISSDTVNTDRTKRYHLYCPLSVQKAVQTGHLMNYWNRTETYEALADYIRYDFDGLRETVAILMSGGRVSVNTRSYQNDMASYNNKDDVLTMLIHLGYLGYCQESGEAYIPNKEIKDEFSSATEGTEWRPYFKTLEDSYSLLEATWKCDADRVAMYLERAHDKVSNRTYNSEAALSYAIRLAYYSALKFYTEIPEMDSGRGYADIVYLPSPKYRDKPVLLVELKYEKSARTAMDQIKDRNYPDRLEHYRGNIIMVGINYDKSLSSEKPGYKHHDCIIERA